MAKTIPRKKDIKFMDFQGPEIISAPCLEHLTMFLYHIRLMFDNKSFKLNLMNEFFLQQSYTEC